MYVEGWLLRPVALAQAGYDDNVTLARGSGPSSSEFTVRGSVDAERNAGRTWFKISGALGQIWHPDADENDATTIDASAQFVYEMTPQFKFRGSAGYSDGIEAWFDNGIFVDGVFVPYTTVAEYVRAPFEAGFDARFGDFTLSATGEAAYADYEALTTLTGLTVPQDFRNGWDTGLRLRGSYQVQPGISLFGEGVARARRYDNNDADRDTWGASAGVAVEFSRLVVGEASAGYTHQNLLVGGETSGATFGAKLSWFATELLSLSIAAERAFDAEVVTTGAGVTSTEPVTYDFARLKAEWEPVRLMLVRGELGYQRTERESTGRLDEFTTLGAGASIVLTGCLRLEIDGEHQFGSSNFADDIDRNRVTIGLKAVY